MRKSNYNLDELDLDLILEITEELKRYFGNEARYILLESSFIRRLEENPEYVHHFDEKYWATVIKNELKHKYSILV
ncbi:hypothetical protein F9U64_06745 [Gracilibacillus oryzae]|uniref:Uncharacterized protein n=1 Tax=Gracilibacillus oryzae TaxID=1672701 RepID=A0A7C8KZF7_9BACI|nr:hypothetical protein [Gracilibacillus oryzae]KAB8138020.1 hypothetical protein F9U64_06745 [Gracilibacillus oryzae]